MKIREYDSGDMAKIRELIRCILCDMYGSLKIEWEDFEDYDVFFVAEKDGEIVGCAAIKKVDDKVASLKRMYVRKDFQKNGIGDKLMKKCFDFCEKSGFERIILTTYSEMENAIQFYKRNEFVEIEKPSRKLFPKSMIKNYKGRRIAMERIL